MKPTMVPNLSDITFARAETDLLCLGMSFCPTSNTDLDELNEDIRHSHTRKLRFRYHFPYHYRKKRARKHKSDVFHPENNNCKKLMKHLRNCSNLVECTQYICGGSISEKFRCEEMDEILSTISKCRFNIMYCYLLKLFIL